jgi:hypothetical protein
MSMRDQAEILVELASDPNVDMKQIKSAGQAVFNALQTSSREQALEGLATLGRGILSPSDQVAAFIAMMCGALVEQGAPANLVADPLLERCGGALALATEFFETCITARPTKQELEGENFDAAVALAAKGHPTEFAGWDMLDKLFPPVIAVLSSDQTYRTQAQSMRGQLDRLADYHNAARWIQKMLTVLHDEPYVAIEPSTRLGIVGKMSGLSENFQLNVLLMDVFPNSGVRRVSAEAAAIARGKGPQQGVEILTGAWNLYTARALRSDGTLPDVRDSSTSDHWIWNEGNPTDIPAIDGFRAILLGPPSYSRTWKSQRDFANLPAEMTVERELTPHEIDQWLGRFASM